MATHGEKRWPPLGRFDGRLWGGFHGHCQAAQTTSGDRPFADSRARLLDPSGSVATAEVGSIAGFSSMVFLVPVGVGRNRLVFSSLPRQTPVRLSRDARVAGPRGPAELAPIHFFTRSELLMFMNCPDCGLKVRLVAPYLLLERCPRCLVRRRQIVEMRVSTHLPNDASAPAPLRHSAG